MKSHTIYICFILIGWLFGSCQPDKFEPSNHESFVFFSLDSKENPPLSVHPVNGVNKTLAVFASSPNEKIVQFIVSDTNHPLEFVSITPRMVDPDDTPILDEEGRLSRPVSTVVFEVVVRVPPNFLGSYEAKFTVVNGKGERKELPVRFEAVNYFMPTTALAAYNGQTQNSNRLYLPTANCFLGFTRFYTYPVDNSVDPPRIDTVNTSITPILRTPSTAITAASRPHVYAHLFTDLTDLDNRTMYLVSPDEPWVADSLRSLNKITANYQPHLMNRVRYIDLGAIDFINLTSAQMNEISLLPFETEGKEMVKLTMGHSYAFKTTEGKTAILYLKKVVAYDSYYSIASPTAYFHLKVEH